MYVNDLAGAKYFYHDVLELPIINYLEEKHLFLKAGESVLLLFNPEDSKTKTSPPPHYGGGNQHFAFEVPASEYESTKKLIQTKGIAIIDEVQWKKMKSFYFNDPEGNALEILPNGGVWE